jgi:hypothetical protein
MIYTGIKMSLVECDEECYLEIKPFLDYIADPTNQEINFITLFEEYDIDSNIWMWPPFTHRLNEAFGRRGCKIKTMYIMLGDLDSVRFECENLIILVREYEHFALFSWITYPTGVENIKFVLMKSHPMIFPSTIKKVEFENFPADMNFTK